MKKFDFRLQKVLEYRQLLEQWAKEAYLEARSSRLNADLALIAIREERHEALKWKPESIESLRAIEAQMKRLDKAEVEQQLVLNLLINEEEKALEAWTEKKIELEALAKLYEKQYNEWKLETERQVQAELDEWATRKRAA